MNYFKKKYIFAAHIKNSCFKERFQERNLML